MIEANAQNVEAELKNVSKNTFIYGMGNVAVKSVTFLFIPLYTHYLSVFEVGIIVLLELLEVLYIAIAPLGIFGALWRFFNPEKKAGREKEFISSNILFIFAVNAVFCTILFLSASFISEVYLSATNLTSLVRVHVLVLFMGLSRTVLFTLFRIYEQAFRFITFVFIDFSLLILITLYFVKFASLSGNS